MLTLTIRDDITGEIILEIRDVSDPYRNMDEVIDVITSAILRHNGMIDD